MGDVCHAPAAPPGLPMNTGLDSKDNHNKATPITAAPLTALAATTAALAAGASPITEKVLGGAGIAQRYRIDVAKPADVVVTQATVPPGASFGWHYHRAAVVVVVKSGTLTL
jgi:hypothetical protein